MDQGIGRSKRRRPKPLSRIVVKLEPPWSVKEEPQDEPSAVYSPAQPMSDNTSGSLLSGHVCQRCSAVFVLSSSLVVHLETFHGETLHYKAPVASRRNDSASEKSDQKLKPPWSIKEEPQDQPSAVYSTAQPMSDNTSESLLSLNTSHVCQRCSATFVLYSSLELHTVTFHGETLQDLLPVSATSNADVGCQFDADIDLLSDYDIKTLVKRRKGRVDDGDTFRPNQEIKPKKHVCKVCHKAFVSVGDFKKHLVVHTGEKAYVCDVCNKAFSQHGSLSKHKQIHTGHRPFVCNVCSRAFFQLCNLKKHKLIHTDYRPFVCDLCSKTFTRAADLKRHGLIHTGDRPHVCDICSKAFNQSSALHRHRLIHSGLKAFVCDKCCKTFMQPVELKKQKPFVCDECSKGLIVSDGKDAPLSIND